MDMTAFGTVVVLCTRKIIDNFILPTKYNGMKLFSSTVNPTFTSSSHNVLKVEDFEEIFFNVFGVEINKKKYSVEQISEYNGSPVVSIPVVLEGVENFYPFVLVKGKFDVLFNKNSTPVSSDITRSETPVLIDEDIQVEKIETPLEIPASRIKPDAKKQLLKQIEAAKVAAIRESNNEWNRKAAQSKSQTEEEQKRLEETLSNAKDKLIDEFFTISNNIKHELIDQTDSRFKEICETIDNKIVDISNTLSDALHKDFKSSSAQFDISIRELVKELYTTLFTPKIDQQLKTIAEDVVEKVKLIETNLSNKLENKADVKLLEGLSVEVNTLRDSNIELNDALNKKFNKALSKVGNVNTKVNELTIAISEDIENKINQVETSINQYYTEKLDLLEQKTFDITEETRKYIVELVQESKDNLISEIRKIKSEKPIEYVIESTGGNQIINEDRLIKDFDKKINTKIDTEVTRLRKYISVYSGGGSVAMQFADGGTMNGNLSIRKNLTVYGTISASNYLGITGGGGSSNYLPLSGGIITGNLSVSNAIQGGESLSIASNITSGGCLIVGCCNTVSGLYSGVFGGYSNGVGGINSSVVGGRFNYAAGDYSNVAGGVSNTASGCYSSIGGGSNNIANQYMSNVGGGLGNIASEQHTYVGGGSHNTASGYYANVSGGSSNTASATLANVAGGLSNTASGSQSNVAGGSSNTASATLANVAGGVSNTASGCYSNVAGGEANIASAFHSNVAGGKDNCVDGVFSNVGGGLYNTASGYASTIVGGVYNCVAGACSNVAGACNVVFGNCSTVAGGMFNIASGNYTTVVGGLCNTTSGGYYNSIGGGKINCSSGQATTISGGRENTASGYYNSIGGGLCNTTSGYYNNIGGGCSNTASGYYNNIGGGCSNTVGGFYSSVGGGKNNIVNASYSGIIGGCNNVVTHNFSYTLGCGLSSTACNTLFTENIYVNPRVSGANKAVTVVGSVSAVGLYINNSANASTEGGIHLDDNTLVIASAAASVSGGYGVAAYRGNGASLIMSSSKILQPLSGVIGWSNSNTCADNTGTSGVIVDTTMSRISAGLVGIGSGTYGSFNGSLKLTNLISVGNISATGTVTAAGGTLIGSVNNSIQNIQSITQAAYSALSPPSPTTFYVITDAPSSGTNIANIVIKTGDYTLTSSDYCVNVTATIPTTMTLPSAVGLAGYIFVIKNSGTSTVTVTGSETIDGSTSLVIATRYNSMTVQSTGAVWIIL